MDTYKIHTKCSNCGRASSTPARMTDIPRGTTVEEYLSNATCLNCGCKALKEFSY